MRERIATLGGGSTRAGARRSRWRGGQRATVLGAAEGVLAVEMGRAAAKNQPYAEEEVTQLLLDVRHCQRAASHYA